MPYFYNQCARVGRILSEDLNTGQLISGVPIENPFVLP
jgi:predicted nucleic acid-binding protein